MNSISCLNCGKQVSQKYCGYCGQKRSVGRLDAETALNEIFEAGLHLTERYLLTFKGVIMAPGMTADAYILGKRQEYQSPISYFLFGYILFQAFAHIVDWPIERGSFGGIEKGPALLGSIGPVVISHIIVMRHQYKLIETFACFMYLYGTAFAILPLSLFLQRSVQSWKIFSHVAVEWRFLLVDGPFLLIIAVISGIFAFQKKLSIVGYLVALALGGLYLLFFRHCMVEALPIISYQCAASK